MVFLSTNLPDMTDKVIAGRYRLAELIGTGGFGVVHRATDLRSREYAIKCLPKSINRTSKDAIRQIREMALHKMVSSHPNIVTIHEVIDEDDFLFVVMDYCPGGDMFSAIADHDAFYGRDALVKSVFLQILDAVQSCHDKGIAHRDLKPENILCNEDFSRVYLADFGLSSRDSYSKEFSCGSSFYMSPECIGEETGFVAYSTMRSDVWSLGVVLTNIVAGRNAWHSATSNDVCFRAFVTDPNYLLSALYISPETHRILKRTFDLNPASRITIPDLRKAIFKVKTFFSDDCQFAQPSLIPADSSLAIPAPVLRVVNCLTMECVSSSAKGVSHLRVPSSPAEEYLYPSPDPNRTRYTPSPEIQYIPRPRLFRNSSSSYSDEGNQWLFRVSSNKLLYGLGIDFGFEKSFALPPCSSVVSTMPSKAKLLIRNFLRQSS